MNYLDAPTSNVFVITGLLARAPTGTESLDRQGGAVPPGLCLTRVAIGCEGRASSSRPKPESEPLQIDCKPEELGASRSASCGCARVFATARIERAGEAGARAPVLLESGSSVARTSLGSGGSLVLVAPRPVAYAAAGALRTRQVWTDG